MIALDWIPGKRRPSRVPYRKKSCVLLSCIARDFSAAATSRQAQRGFTFRRVGLAPPAQRVQTDPLFQEILMNMKDWLPRGREERFDLSRLWQTIIAHRQGPRLEYPAEMAALKNLASAATRRWPPTSPARATASPPSASQ
jgi:hypothetical protein